MLIRHRRRRRRTNQRKARRGIRKSCYYSNFAKERGENLLLILTGKGGKLVSSKAKEEISDHLCTRKTTHIGICVYEFRKNYFFLFSLREYHACDLSAFYFPSFSSQIK